MDPRSWLQDMCRVCGGKLSRYKVSYDCHTTINKAKLQLIGVTIASDQEGVHPPRFCYGCSKILNRTEKASKEGRDYTPRLTRFEWGGSSEVEHGRVGRKPKKAPIGRPSDLIKDLVTYVKDRGAGSSMKVGGLIAKRRG